MGNAKDLYGISNNSKMREAMKQLGSQFGIKDKNSFVQILLMGASSTGDESLSSNDLYESSKETNTSLQALSDAIISMQGEGKYVQQIVEIFENYITNTKDSDVATALLSEPPDANSKDKHGPPLSFTGPEAPKQARGFLRDVGITDIVPDMNQNITFDKDHRSVAVVEFHHPNLNFANRDSSAASVFLQALPSIEISKAVPYLDVKTIVKGGPTADSADLSQDSSVFTNGISIYKFLHGEKIEKSDSTVVTLASSVPKEFANPSPVLQGGVGQDPVTKPGITVAGMEMLIWMHPYQTMEKGQHLKIYH